MDIDKIITDYHQKIFKLCLFYLNNNRQEAEEMVQEIFIKIIKKLNSFKGESDIFTWIYRLSVNTLINYIKRKKIVEFISFDNLKNLKETSGNLSHAMNDPAVKFERDEIREKELKILKKCIDLLSNREKTAFFLFYYENLRQKQIAGILNTSVPAVESLVHKAKKKIKKCTANY